MIDLSEFNLMAGWKNPESQKSLSLLALSTVETRKRPWSSAYVQQKFSKFSETKQLFKMCFCWIIQDRKL